MPNGDREVSGPYKIRNGREFEFKWRVVTAGPMMRGVTVRVVAFSYTFDGMSQEWTPSSDSAAATADAAAGELRCAEISMPFLGIGPDREIPNARPCALR